VTTASARRKIFAKKKKLLAARARAAATGFVGHCSPSVRQRPHRVSGRPASARPHAATVPNMLVGVPWVRLNHVRVPRCRPALQSHICGRARRFTPRLCELTTGNGLPAESRVVTVSPTASAGCPAAEWAHLREYSPRRTGLSTRCPTLRVSVENGSNPCGGSCHMT